ncbi:MAG: MurR/RpiR family transcriptional regulator [Pseudomonadota bacterium]
MNAGIRFEAVGPQIRMQLPTLTATEKQVAEAILNLEGLSDQTPIKEVAQGAGVSEALVVKVAKKLGFKGFRELRAGIVGYRNAHTNALYSEIADDDDLDAISKKVFKTSIQALEETLAILDTAMMARAVDALDAARQVDFYGVGGSAQIARDVAHKFLRIGRRVHVFDDPHLMMMSASVLGPGDVVVAFSHSGTTEAVLEPAELARERGATVIALTNYTSSPLSEIADLVLASTARGGPLLGENAAARIAQLNLLDVLFVALAQRNREAAETNLENTMSAVTSKRRRR